MKTNRILIFVFGLVVLASLMLEVPADLQIFLDSEFRSTETMFEAFESASSWTKTSANGTVTDDTAHVKQGTQSIKWMSLNATSTDARKDITSTNMSGKQIRIWIYIDTENNLDTLTLYFYSGTTKHAKLNIVTGALLDDGWNHIDVEKGSMTYVSGFVVADWATITRLRIYVYALAAKTVNLSFDNYRAVTNPFTARLTFRFDDEYTSQYTIAFPKMTAYSYDGVCGIRTAEVGTSGYMTKAQMLEMYNVGWDMVSHTKTHLSISAPTTSPAKLIDELSGSQTWLENNGFSKSSRFFVSPYYAWNHTAMSYVDDYYLAANLAIGYYSHLPPSRDVNFYTKQVTRTTTPTTVQGWINTAITYKLWLILTFHDFKESPTLLEEYTPTNFQTILDYAYSSGITVATFSEVFDELLGLSNAPVKFYYSNGNLTEISYDSLKLTFTISATSGTTNSKIYCGNEGTPLSVSGASTWSYNGTTKILTVQAVHASSVTIVLDWSNPTPYEPPQYVPQSYYRLIISVSSDRAILRLNAKVSLIQNKVLSAYKFTDFNNQAIFSSVKKGLYEVVVESDYGNAYRTLYVDMNQEVKLKVSEVAPSQSTSTSNPDWQQQIINVIPSVSFLSEWFLNDLLPLIVLVVSVPLLLVLAWAIKEDKFDALFE